MQVIIIDTSFVPIWVAIFICIIIPMVNSHKFNISRFSRKNRGENKMLPKELMKEFIGKVCEITLFNSGFGVAGKIEAVEENWLKVNEKGKIRLLNGDMIMNIKILPDKYQK